MKTQLNAKRLGKKKNWRTEKNLKTIRQWRFVPMCNYCCPTVKVTQNEANTPRGLALTLFMIAKEMREFDKKRVEKIYQCTTCDFCSALSSSGHDIPKVIMDARADIVDQQLAPTIVSEVERNIENERNPYGKPAKAKFELISKEVENLKKRTAKIIYFMGCTSACYHPEIVKATINLLKKVKADFMIMEKENCCGAPAYEMGLYSIAEKLAKENVKAINETECETVIFSCPHCYWGFKKLYPELGIKIPDIKMMHVSEYIGHFLKGKKISTSKIAKTIAYHDPCYLGRRLGVYDSPRDLIREIEMAKLKEMKWNKSKSFCCGSGGGLLFTNQELANQIGKQLLAEAIKVGADILVTACPFCKENLAKEEIDIEILDIAELVSSFLVI